MMLMSSNFHTTELLQRPQKNSSIQNLWTDLVGVIRALDLALRLLILSDDHAPLYDIEVKYVLLNFAKFYKIFCLFYELNCFLVPIF